MKALGVRTVVSVDGFKPDLVTAGLFGLKYVHLPHGYDGISERRSMELAAVVRNLPGPVYVHCHHGRHRSPAAATVAGIISGLISKDVGDQILKSAGTSHRYSGLYRSVASAVRATDSELDLLNVQWPESVEPPPLVKTMTDLEHTVENLSALSEAGWPAVGQSSYASAQHQALMLREQMTEFLRVTMSGKPSAAIHANYRSFIKASKKDARQLDDLLAADITTKSQRKKASALLMSIKQRCADCHSQFRD